MRQILLAGNNAQTLNRKNGLASRKLGQCGKDQLRLAHMVTEVLGLEPLQILVRFHAHARPFLMNDIRENGEFLALLDVVSIGLMG